MNKKKIIFFFASLAMFVLIIISVMIVSIPDNPISFRYRLYFNKNLNALLPEGWAFFTRDCKEEQIFIYFIDDKKRLKEISFKTSNPNQLFGLSRHNRIMHSKLGSILSEIDDSYYYVDTAPLKNLDLKKINAVNVKIKNSNLCGEYLLKLQRPQSWTWFSSKITPPLNTYKLIRINFKCYDK